MGESASQSWRLKYRVSRLDDGTSQPISMDVQEILSYLQKKDVVLFIEHVGLVVLVYDYFLTLGAEISFVWTRGPWNLGKVLFFLARYLAFVCAGLLFYVNTSRSIPLETCISWLNAGFYSSMGVILIIEFVFGLRVWALWGRSKKVAMTRETLDDFKTEYYRMSGYCPPQFSGGSEVHAGSNTVTFGFIMIAVYEAVVLFLTLIKASQYGWLDPHGSNSRFINGFISQGVAYNCLTLMASVANVIVRYKLQSAYVDLLGDFQPVIHSVLTSRMMLYLRRNAFQQAIFSSSEILTGIVAADNPSLPRVSRPAESCPQINVLDLGSPLALEHRRNWREGDQYHR